MPKGLIREGHKLASLLPLFSLKEPKSWGFLDIDNTVIEGQTALGSDQWFVGLCAAAIATIPDRDRAIAMTIAVYHEVEKLVRAKPVEEETARLIADLQSRGVPIFAITARDRCLQPATVRQLRDNGIDFSRDLPREFSTRFLLDVGGREGGRDQEDTDEVPFYQGGVIYCCGKDKGLCMKAFFEKVGHKPSHVVMADDKLKHLQHVADVLEGMGIRFDGLRYGGSDEKVRTFDMALANEQLVVIRRRLPKATQRVIDDIGVCRGVKGDDHVERFFYPSLALPEAGGGGEGVTIDEEESEDMPLDAVGFFGKRLSERNIEDEPPRKKSRVEEPPPVPAVEEAAVRAISPRG